MTNLPEFAVYKPANFFVPRRYEIQEVLGRGLYGVVCLAVDTAAANAPLAVKKVCKILHKDVLLRRAIRELKLMSFFRGHRNVRIRLPCWPR